MRQPPQLAEVSSAFNRRWRNQTVRRLRPFARRAFKTFLPALVAIRARKPWVRFLFKLLGWKVRFMSVPMRATNMGRGFYEQQACMSIIRIYIFKVICGCYY